MRTSHQNPETSARDRPAPSRGPAPDRPEEAPGDGRRLSIGLVSPGWPPEAFSNGIVSYAASVAEGLGALGHRVTILATALAGTCDRAEPVYDLRRPGGNRRLARRAADWLWYRAAPRAMLEHRDGEALAASIARAVAERGIEVVEMEESLGWAGRVQQAVGIPVSVRLHGPWFLNGSALGMAEDAGFRRRVREEGWAIGRAAAVTAPSLDVLEKTRAHYGLPLERAEVIPNPTGPVDPSRHWSAGGCTPGTVLFVGRFDRHKGGDLIVEAFGRVLRAVPDARLCFAGPDRGLTDDRGRSWDLEGFVDDRLPGARAAGRVRLLGRQPHSALDDLRLRAAVTVVCSRYEVFGLTAAEAMALGCPVVAARAGGIPEVVRDGVDGLLHRAGDPDDLAARIVELLRDPARAAELGRRAACRSAQEFHPVAVAARMAAHYRRLLRPITIATRA